MPAAVLHLSAIIGYERVYLPLCKVADTPFHIQGDGMFHLDVKQTPLTSTSSAYYFRIQEIDHSGLSGLKRTDDALWSLKLLY